MSVEPFIGSYTWQVGCDWLGGSQAMQIQQHWWRWAPTRWDLFNGSGWELKLEQGIICPLDGGGENCMYTEDYLCSPAIWQTMTLGLFWLRKMVLAEAMTTPPTCAVVLIQIRPCGAWRNELPAAAIKLKGRWVGLGEPWPSWCSNVLSHSWENILQLWF